MKPFLNMMLIAGLMLGCQYSQVLPERGYFVAAQINGTDWLINVDDGKSWKGFSQNVFYLRSKIMQFRAVGIDNINPANSPMLSVEFSNLPLDSLKLPYTFPDQAVSNAPAFFLRWRDTNVRPVNDSRCERNSSCVFSAKTGDTVVVTITKRTETVLEGEFSGIFYPIIYGFGILFLEPSDYVVIKKGRFRMPYERINTP